MNAIWLKLPEHSQCGHADWLEDPHQAGQGIGGSRADDAEMIGNDTLGPHRGEHRAKLLQSGMGLKLWEISEGMLGEG
jgi:hypothetical protein